MGIAPQGLDPRFAASRFGEGDHFAADAPSLAGGRDRHAMERGVLAVGAPAAVEDVVIGRLARKIEDKRPLQLAVRPTTT